MFWVFLVSLFSIIAGCIYAINPYQGWYWHEGWRFRDGDVEPSEAYLTLYRISGFLGIIVGIGLAIFLFTRL